MQNQDEPAAPPVASTTNPDDELMSSDAVVLPGSENSASENTQADDGEDIYTKVSRKISDAHNVLIALSSDPSVDEMAAAIGLSLYLDRLGKHATAIYSGATPNALEFLNPEETFESTADTLQDFVIALDKEKADHLRYKLDGEYVKIYITPYKKRIVEEDLDFSYGDYNVDLVLALDVANGIDLDSALREHGRIMHNAVIINVTTGNPGKFGEIEWSDKAASSVSEMLSKLLYSVNSKIKIEKEEAMAFLTGIVAATNRFADANVTSETMKVVARLIDSGANPQLIAKNITDDVENEFYASSGGFLTERSKKENDSTKLDIDHGDEIDADETKIVDGTITEKESTLLDDLKKAEASLSQTGAETVTKEDEPVKVETSEETKADTETKAESDTESKPESTEQKTDSEEKPTDKNSFIAEKPEKVIQPFASMDLNANTSETEKYSKMIEDALNEPDPVKTEPVASPEPEMNPAASAAPAVSINPEINGVPEINYMPMPSDELLPPPPAPPIDFDTPDKAPAFDGPVAPLDFETIAPKIEETSPEPSPVMSEPLAPAAPEPMPSIPEPIAPATPPIENPTSLGSQPAMQDQVYAPQAADPSAFKIPGM